MCKEKMSPGDQKQLYEVAFLSNIPVHNLQVLSSVLELCASFLQPETTHLWLCCLQDQVAVGQREHKSNSIWPYPFGAVASPNGREYALPSVLIPFISCCWPLCCGYLCCRIAWGLVHEGTEKKEIKWPKNVFHSLWASPAFFSAPWARFRGFLWDLCLPAPQGSPPGSRLSEFRLGHRAG